MIKAEQFKDQAEFDLMLAYLQANLASTHTISPALLAAMIQTRAGFLFAKRNEANELIGAQVWLTIPDPLNNGKRLCRKVGECGNVDGFNAAQEAAFSMLEGGWSYL